MVCLLTADHSTPQRALSRQIVAGRPGECKKIILWPFLTGILTLKTVLQGAPEHAPTPSAPRPARLRQSNARLDLCFPLTWVLFFFFLHLGEILVNFRSWNFGSAICSSLTHASCNIAVRWLYLYKCVHCSVVVGLHATAEMNEHDCPAIVSIFCGLSGLKTKIL